MNTRLITDATSHTTLVEKAMALVEMKVNQHGYLAGADFVTRYRCEHLGYNSGDLLQHT